MKSRIASLERRIGVTPPSTDELRIRPGLFPPADAQVLDRCGYLIATADRRELAPAEAAELKTLLPRVKKVGAIARGGEGATLEEIFALHHSEREARG